MPPDLCWAWRRNLLGLGVGCLLGCGVGERVGFCVGIGVSSSNCVGIRRMSVSFGRAVVLLHPDDRRNYTLEELAKVRSRPFASS